MAYRGGGQSSRLWAALAVVVTLTGVACDGGSGDDDAAAVPGGASATPIPGSGQDFDGCWFIERWDAHEILRGSVRPMAKPTEHLAAAACGWEVQDEENPRSLQLSVFRGRDLYDPEAFEDDETFERVEGVGDDAFFVASPGVQLYVLVGEFSVLLSVDGFGSDESLERETVKDQLVKLVGRVVAGLGRGDDNGDREAAG